MEWYLPVIWAAVIGVAVAMYVILDGFDLGIGILFPFAQSESQRDQMMRSVGPFWDGNETWLVLGGAGLLVAFPLAYAVIMPAMYLPVIVMLLALVFRGVAFEFRLVSRSKTWWNYAFTIGSTLAAFSQGIILGGLIQGITVKDGAFAGGHFDWLTPFTVLCGVALIAGYALLGATWLIMKTEGDLQRKAIRWAKLAWWPVVAGMVLISLATPWISATVRERWFELPAIIALLAIPLTTAIALVTTRLVLDQPIVRKELCWLPFVLLIAVFVFGFLGLAYSIYPFVVIDQLTIWQAASSPAALKVILIGVCISVPAIAAYTVFSYRVFWGKATELRYG